MCGQVSNNEHATSHYLTRLNVEFADLIATCNMTKILDNPFCYTLHVLRMLHILVKVNGSVPLFNNEN